MTKLDEAELRGQPSNGTPPGVAGRRTRVVIVHDYLTQAGGAERVVAGMLRGWPDAEVRTLLYDPSRTFAEFAGARIVTSPLQKLAPHVSHRVLLPLMPAALHFLTVASADVVVSSSSGWAHGVAVPDGIPHICYCHTPARWLYDTARYTGSRTTAALSYPALSALRRWDRRAAARPTVFVANSENVRLRIGRIYGRDAVVLHPPVEVGRFRPTPIPEHGYLLVVSRLLHYKRVELAVEAGSRLGLEVVVAGEGPERRRLRAYASDRVRFLGRVSDHELARIYAGSRLCFVGGEEDFGIAALEANAAGRPVVAFGRGGALETVAQGVTGVLFGEQTAIAAVDAVRTALARDWDPELLARHAAGFSPEVFLAGLKQIVAAHVGLRAA
jgi:glycosyltransferase involved in cell wall biosynthesis